VAQERLVQSERLAAIGQMSAKVSHEVRNPLGAISLNAELLEDELQALPEDRRAEAATLVTAIRSQVDVLSTVTEEYLRFARLPKPKLEIMAVAPVIEELADFVREELKARGVQLSVAIPEDLPALRLDAGQIRRTLLNLVRNAAEAMPDGGSIMLRVFANAELRERATGRMGEWANGRMGDGTPAPPLSHSPIQVVVEVKDTGVGIPVEHLDKIFEPFFTTKDGGTGLGLAIASQIVADHGGRLTCESTPGAGTTFRLILPISGGVFMTSQGHQKP
jgi:signal transduction histidine kinase